MEILRWQIGNALKNYQYLICDAEKNTVIIDPLDGPQIRQTVKKFALKPKAILITHEHTDHVGDAAALSASWGVPAYTSTINQTLMKFEARSATGMLQISRELNVRFHETPGHTQGHVAFEVAGFFFSGDCLFQGGCGHCRTPGADIAEHNATLNLRIKALSPELMLMPGHYYATKNLEYALYVDPNNARAIDFSKRIKTLNDELEHKTTLRDERHYNPFLRLSSRPMRQRLGEISGRDFTDASDLAVFTELRRLRDGF